MRHLEKGWKSDEIGLCCLCFGINSGYESCFMMFHGVFGVKVAWIIQLSQKARGIVVQNLCRSPKCSFQAISIAFLDLEASNRMFGDANRNRCINLGS